MTRKEQIKSAYKLTGGHASFYDGKQQWLFGGEKYAVPVLKAIDEFMEMPAE